MRYLPHTQEEIKDMLQVVGVDDLEGLFSMIPEDCRRKNAINLPDPLTEWELNAHLSDMSQHIATSSQYKNYLGAGSYEHYIPAANSYLLSRSEFVTSYTPYQPEMSQGTLQGIYEYQTLCAQLLGMDVANASLYDGASALAEALLMAIRITKKNRVAVSSLIHPYYRQVVQTYLKPAGFEIIELKYTDTGRTDLSDATGMKDLAAVAVQSPNFLGCIEDMKGISEIVHDENALLIVSFNEPLAFGVFRNPGSQAADISCGEGQSLGISQSFGGPGLGMFACRSKYTRQMPGRLIGQTVDGDGNRGFVLTLATREQHIRRERATSNICTNSSLCALTAAMYMAALGRTGFRELAQLNRDKSEYLKHQLRDAGINIPFTTPTFNEFVAEFPPEFKARRKRLFDKKMIIGLPLVDYYPELQNHYLLCVTEIKSKDDLDILVREATA